MDNAANTSKCEVDYEVVVVGAGICGLATAVALHRKHIKCVVFESSKSLRPTGGAIGIMRNGWRALDQLGVASTLRQTAFPILGSQDIWLDKNKQQEMSFMSAEARCLRRSDLINVLYDSLQPETVKFGHKIVSVKLDPKTTCPVLQLEDGSSVVTKGGSAGLEDAVVLARSLARKLKQSPTNLTSIGEAFDDYVREPKMRVVRLSTQTYLTGMLLMEDSSLLVKLFCIMFMLMLFRNGSAHTKYDCGTL